MKRVVCFYILEPLAKFYINCRKWSLSLSLTILLKYEKKNAIEAELLRKTLTLHPSCEILHIFMPPD